MRSFHKWLIPLLCASCGGGALPSGSDDGLVVHEWGTYTSVQGSNGATLDGMQHEEEALPAFVMQRAAADEHGGKGIEALPGAVNQKLETPVLYFYSPKPLNVRATVDFPGGIISQWYPAAATFAPEIGAMTAVANGRMAWEASVEPGMAASAMRAVPADSVWAPSRNVAAAGVNINGEHEKFIFYRGLGKFDVPFRVESRPDGLVDLINDSDEEIPDVFLLRVHAAGGVTIPLGKIAPRAALRGIAPPVEGKEHDLDEYVAATMTTVAAALERSGLYADESRAMVETWSRSYFRSRGLRVLYVAPRAWTDRLLPLQVEPTPRAIARTLVGRVEVMTVGEEQAILEQVTRLSPEALATTLGRFAEPKLRRVRTLTGDLKLQGAIDAAIAFAAAQP